MKKMGVYKNGGGEWTAKQHEGEEPLELVRATLSDPLDYYKKAVASIIELYFSTGDVGEAGSDLFVLGSSEYHPYFVKRLVYVAMDRHDKEKELASGLLSALYSDVINPNQIRDGFVLLLESADDFVVNIPDAVDVLALFLALAVVDEILPPAFLPGATKALPQSSKGYQVVQTAEKRFLSDADHAKLVKRRWGGKTRSSVEEGKKKFTDILNEYVETGETYRAFCCIMELSVSFFHHQVVKRALITGMENSAVVPLVLKFLKETASKNWINSSQMVKGFSMLKESLDDLALGIPSAKAKFDLIVAKAISGGWLDASFSYPLKEEIVTIIPEVIDVLIDSENVTVPAWLKPQELVRKIKKALALLGIYSEIKVRMVSGSITRFGKKKSYKYDEYQTRKPEEMEMVYLDDESDQAVDRWIKKRLSKLAHERTSQFTSFDLPTSGKTLVLGVGDAGYRAKIHLLRLLGLRVLILAPSINATNEEITKSGEWCRFKRAMEDDPVWFTGTKIYENVFAHNLFDESR